MPIPTAVEAERQRTFSHFRAIEGICHIKDMRFSFTRCIFQRHLGDCRRIVQALSVDRDGMVRYHRSLIHVAAHRGTGPAIPARPRPAAAGAGVCAAGGVAGAGVVCAARPRASDCAGMPVNSAITNIGNKFAL